MLETFAATWTGDGLKTTLVPTPGARRRYTIRMVWAPPIAVIEKMASDNTAMALVMGRFGGILGAATKESGFRSDTAEIRVAGTDFGWAFPTSCARKVLRLAKQDTETAGAHLLQCVEVKQYGKPAKTPERRSDSGSFDRSQL